MGDKTDIIVAPDNDLSVIVSFCSFEKDLIRDVLAPVCQISRDVILVYCTHFSNGERDTEVDAIVNDLKHDYPIRTVRFPYKEMNVPVNFWITENRLHGFAHANKNWMLWIDSDEVLRSPASFLTWFKSADPSTSYKFSNYWYFMSKKRRSKVLEDSVVLVHRSRLHMNHFRQYNRGEREVLFSAGKHQEREVMKQEPLFDHFSWVRDPVNLRRKVKAWGHRNDKNWIELVDKALQEDPLTTRDFVHGYDYDILD